MSVKKKPDIRETEGLREQKKKENFRKIIKAARELFSKKDYNAITIREIAVRAGTGTGTLYSYVKDKTELLTILSAEDMNTVRKKIRKNLGKCRTTEESVLEIFRIIFAHHSDNPAFAKMIVKELTFEKRNLPEDFGPDPFLLLFHDIASVLRSDASGTEDAEERAEHIFAVHFYYLIQWLSGRMTEAEAWEKFVIMTRHLLIR